MEFHEKLKELRAQKGLTQEELAEALYVSRTAVSKWESGRGYPNLDSLKAIAAYFSVTVDDLLSERDLPMPAEEKPTAPSRLRGVVLGLTDVSAALLLFLPFFASRTGEDGAPYATSLIALQGVNPYLKIISLALTVCLILTGALTLTGEICRRPLRGRLGYLPSLGVGLAAAVLFIAARQPYAAVFGVVALAVKAFFALKYP